VSFLFFSRELRWNQWCNRVLAKYFPNVLRSPTASNKKFFVREQIVKIMMDESSEINRKVAAI
jgi:hypothetical protein